MSPCQTPKAPSSPAKSVESSDSSFTDDKYLTARQTPEGSISGDMIERRHSTGSSDLYVSAEEQSEKRATKSSRDSSPIEPSQLASVSSSSSVEATQVLPMPFMPANDRGLSQYRGFGQYLMSIRRQPVGNWKRSSDQDTRVGLWSRSDTLFNQEVASGMNELGISGGPEELLSEDITEFGVQDLENEKNTSLENMSTTTQKGKDDPSHPLPLKEERSTTPKAAFLPLPEPDDALQRFPDPDLPEGHHYHGMKASDPVIYTKEHPYGIPMVIPRQNIERIPHDIKIRPLNAQQAALAGGYLGSASNVAPDRYMRSQRRLSRVRVNQSQGSRRSHAIPIVRPPSRASARSIDPPSLNAYAHDVPGVPSHYVPLHGACHGTFYDPVTNLYVGDGAPRSKPERPDGTYPCTTEAMMDAVPAPKRPLSDPIHIQSKAFIDNATASSGDHVATSFALSTPYSVYSNSLAASSIAFKLYLCRCTGKWLREPHDCTEGPIKDIQIPEKVGYAPWEPLPEGWINNQIMVDRSVYPWQNCPLMAGLPANWFIENPVYDLVTHRRLGLESEFAAASAGSPSSRYARTGANPSEITPTTLAPLRNVSPQTTPTAPMPLLPSSAKATVLQPRPNRTTTPPNLEADSDSEPDSGSSDASVLASTTRANAEAGEGSSSGATAITHGAGGLSLDGSEEMEMENEKAKVGKRKRVKRRVGVKKW